MHQLRYGRAEPEQELLLNMAATRYGLDDVSGYDPVHLDSFSAYLRRSNQYVGLDRHFEWVRVPETDKLRRLGVRYYVAQPGQQPPDLPVVFRSKHAVIVEDPEALPLARLNLSTGGIRRGKIIVRQPDRVVIDTPDARGAGRLVLADPAYPGWKVTVDGRAATSLSSRGHLPRRRPARGPAPRRLDVRPAAAPHRRPVSVAALLSLLVVAAVPLALRRRRAAPPAPRRGTRPRTGARSAASCRALRRRSGWPPPPCPRAPCRGARDESAADREVGLL